MVGLTKTGCASTICSNEGNATCNKYRADWPITKMTKGTAKVSCVFEHAAIAAQGGRCNSA